MVSERKFRKAVLADVNDAYLKSWWTGIFGKWHDQQHAEAIAPVQTRLSYFASSKRARAILGQPSSTIDLRRTIQDGDVLLISTSQGAVGRDVAALVGACLLNMVDGVIREQGALAQWRRRGALVVVDEMQTMPGVDYESMLSELGKFGASFILATQSLAKLADISPTMEDTILANVGCLAVFQVSGSDARRLVWELGRERMTEDDITSLPVHHCYVRATVGKERMPAFSMMVKPGPSPEIPGWPAAFAPVRPGTPLRHGRPLHQGGRTGCCGPFGRRSCRCRRRLRRVVRHPANRFFGSNRFVTPGRLMDRSLRGRPETKP